MAMLTIFIVMNIILVFVLFSALLFGLIQCKKYSFSGGFYFFLFIIIGKIYSFFIPYFISRIIKNYISLDNTTERTLGMTTGELVAWISYTDSSIKYISEIIAYSFLVFGLYRMWKSKVRS
ncbi:hypothetical protein [Paenibacillus sp. RC67]|uniref:hypothetical protein n=1 Tax=Paenibacillus sp. RC67 TaxID=3039392 RepID=UPI0024AD007A|nr:hypothetical protein [Paenibacillus sp. RC67]